MYDLYPRLFKIKNFCKPILINTKTKTSNKLLENQNQCSASLFSVILVIMIGIQGE